MFDRWVSRRSGRDACRDAGIGLRTRGAPRGAIDVIDRKIENGERSEQPPTQPAAGEARPVVVGIAAAGSAIESLITVVGRLTPPPDVAVVLILQYIETLDVRPVRDTLAERGIGLSDVQKNTKVTGGAYYLADPNVLLTIRGGRLRVRETQEPPGERATIDSFFVSLADDCEHRAIGVVLAGTAGDGTLGLAAIKECGGLTIVERGPENGHEPGNGNTPDAIADFVLAADAIAERIIAHARHLARLQDRQHFEAMLAEMSGSLSQMASLLRNQTGHDFHGYKPQTFLRRVQRRMQVVQTDQIAEYIGILRSRPEEVENLFNDLLIGVTHFFRDPKEFEFLEREVIPKILDGKEPGDFVRVWVLGCATGEEAYSIAILLREQMARMNVAPHVQIFATDIDGRALAAARSGRYPAVIGKYVPAERLARWFVKEGNTYVVVKELREMCVFSPHNVIRDAPFSRLDLVSCRNLLIYLSAELQKKVLPLFHFALLPDSFLFLGSSENITHHSNLFEPVDRRARIFKRLDTGVRAVPEMPLAWTGSPRRVEEPGTGRRNPDVSLSSFAERVAERYTPAYMIADEKFEVLHFSGRAGRYIEPMAGVATLDMLNLVHRDLRPDLRAALLKVAETDVPVHADGLEMAVNGHRARVDVIVEPMRQRANGPRRFVVVFKEAGTRPDSGDDPAMRDEHVRRLETELRGVRERLQTTIEELESTNEELKSSNEEYQSLNEELQSANEELETSREELQSVNEELTTVNSELAHRVQDLTRATSDLKNLLESTQIATLFLDNELNVTNFTPAVTEIFHLVESDVGRPISHIKSRIAFEALADDIRGVMRTLTPVEREVDNPANGARYIVRVLPYRSVDNFIAGVVVTFLDVTQLTRAQDALRESEERFRAVANLVPDLLWTHDPSGDATWFNRRWLEYTGQSPEQALGSGWLDVIHADDRTGTADKIRASIRSGQSFGGELRVKGEDGTYRWFLMRAEPRRNGGGEVVQWAGTFTDIDDHRTTLDTLRASESRAKLLLSELQHRVRNTLSVVRSIVRRTAESSDSVGAYVSDLEGRINTFARVQAELTRDPISGVGLRQLVTSELNALEPNSARIRGIEGPNVRLSPKTAETLALVVHELATNAAKYGALSAPSGELGVTWSVEAPPEGQRLTFRWNETGVELSGRAPTRRGFGSELIQKTIAYELGADSDLSFAPDGLKCTLVIPLTGRVTVEPGRGGAGSRPEE